MRTRWSCASTRSRGSRRWVVSIQPSRRRSVGDGRFEFEYKRNGTRKLLAAFNPHTGEVYGEMRPTRKAQDLVEFMEAVAALHPDGDVHIVWDNLNIHYDGKDERWTRFNERHGGRFHFHYTPIHASWVNQIELLFSILQRRVLRYGEFDSLQELDDAVVGFLDHWNMHERKPFRWTFKATRCKLATRSAPDHPGSAPDGDGCRMSADQHRLEELIAATDGFDHLRVKKYGDHLILLSGEPDDEQKHARLTRFRGDEWGLSFWHHTGRWEKAPFTGSLPDVFRTLAENFPMFLEHY